MSVKGTTIQILMGQVIVLLVMMLFPAASTAAPARVSSGNDADNDSNRGSARRIRRNYFHRYKLAVPFAPDDWVIEGKHGKDVLVDIDDSEAESGNQRSNQPGQRRLKKSKGPGEIRVGPKALGFQGPGPVYVWPVPKLSYISPVPTKRDEGIMENLLPTFGLPLSDTQFQVIRRYNDNIFLEQVFDPERIIWMATEVSHIMATSAANSGGNLAINQAQSAIDFTESYLTNFTAEAGNEWQKIRDKLFLPMAVLLLLPGAVLAQAKAVVASGSSVIEQSQGPFEGIMRSIVAAFLIPGSFLVINYGIDVANSITFTIGDEYKRLFGSDMYRDAQCTEIRAFEPNDPNSNNNAVIRQQTDPHYTRDPFRNFHEDHKYRDKDPCAGGLDVSIMADEDGLVKKSIERPAVNFANVALTGAWNVLCAFQMAFLYYLWCMGPIAAALWVWPIKGLRSAFPSWVEGVITLCFWSLFWNTAVLLLACFRGVADNSVVIVSALNFLANVCVKYAFDFSGLVSEAGYQAASDMTRDMNKARDDAQKMAVAGGGAGQPATPDGNGNGSSPFGALSASRFGPDGSGTNLGAELERRQAEQSRFGGNGDGAAFAGLGLAGGLLGSAPEIAARPGGALVGPPPSEGIGAASVGLGALLATGLIGGPPLGLAGLMAGLSQMYGSGGALTPAQLAALGRNRDGTLTPAAMESLKALTPTELNQLLKNTLAPDVAQSILDRINQGRPDLNNDVLPSLARGNAESRQAAADLAPLLAKDTSFATALGLYTPNGQPPTGAFSIGGNGVLLGSSQELLTAQGQKLIDQTTGQPYTFSTGTSGTQLAVRDGSGNPVSMPILNNDILGNVPLQTRDALLAHQLNSHGITPPILQDAITRQPLPISTFNHEGRPLQDLGPRTINALNPYNDQQVLAQYSQGIWTSTDPVLNNLPSGVQKSFNPQSVIWTAQSGSETVVYHPGSVPGSGHWQFTSGAPAYLTNDGFSAQPLAASAPLVAASPSGTAFSVGSFMPNNSDVLPLRGPATPERLVLDTDGIQTGATPVAPVPQPQPGFDPGALVQSPGQNAFVAPTVGAYAPQPHIIEQPLSPYSVPPQQLIPDVYATNLGPASPAPVLPNIGAAEVPPAAAVQPMAIAQHVPTGPEVVQIMPQTTPPANPVVVGEQQHPVVGEQPRIVASITPPISAIPPTPVQIMPQPQANPQVPTSLPTFGQIWSQHNLGQGSLDPLGLIAAAGMRMAPKKPPMPDPRSRRAPEVVVKRVPGSLQQNMGANQQGVVNTDEQEIQRLSKDGLDKITGVQRLGGTKILMVVAPENFTDEELLKPKSIFIGEGADVKIASNRLGEARGTSGTIVTPDMLVNQVDPAQFDAIVVVGGSGTQELLSNDKDLHRLLRTMSDTGKIVAGISLSSMILARAGVLEGRKVTGWPSAESITALEEAHASYIDKSVVQDGEIITGNSPEHVDEFADTIVEELSKIASVSAIEDEHSSAEKQGESPAT